MINPRVIIAGVVLFTSTVLAAFDINSFVHSIGFLAAGYLFGTYKRA